MGLIELMRVLPEAENFCALVTEKKMPEGDILVAKINIKYIKIIHINKHGRKSAWGFIDENGDILKANNWTGPVRVKGSRGNIFVSRPWEQVDWTGPRYLISGNRVSKRKFA